MVLHSSVPVDVFSERDARQEHDICDAQPPADSQAAHALMVGFNYSYLKAVRDRVPGDSIIVLEEPDIIRKRDLAGKECELSCLAEIVPAMYQQADGVVEVGRAVHERWGVDAVVPGTEYAVPGAAALAAALGRPGAGTVAAQALRDKARLREITTRAGIRNPQCHEAKGPEDIVTFADGGPVVVKPANRQASVGVQLLDRCGPAEAEAAWQAMVCAVEYDQVPDRPLSWRYLVERRLRGPEYSLEALVRDGDVIFQNVTEKAVIPGVRPIELAHLVPAPLDPAQLEAVTDAMRLLVAAIRFDTGMLHAEWILTADGPTLIECAGRCPGDRIVDLIDLAYETRLRVDLITLLAGCSLELPDRPRQASAIRFLTAPPGRVVRVNGEERARRRPGVREVHVGLSEGSEATAWQSSWDRPGFVIVTAPQASTARTRASAAAETVKIITS